MVGLIPCKVHRLDGVVVSHPARKISVNLFGFVRLTLVDTPLPTPLYKALNPPLHRLPVGGTVLQQRLQRQNTQQSSNNTNNQSLPFIAGGGETYRVTHVGVLGLEVFLSQLLRLEGYHLDEQGTRQSGP